MKRILSPAVKQCIAITVDLPSGASQSEIAQEMGVSRQYVNNIFRKLRKEYTRREVDDGILSGRFF